MEKQSITDQVRVKTMQEINQQPKKTTVIGNYSLGKTIGKGTFGKVKEAIHLQTNQKVAVKIIDKRSMQDDDDRERVKKEVEIMKKVRHPNITYLYEIIETADLIYLFVEFADQGELFRVMTTEVRLKERAAGRIFYQILNAVQYLHRLDIAHRDLKPQNILLDPDFNVKLIDFGLSNYSPKEILLNTACGSPCYAPPEMVAGKKYNGIIGDIWSLGIVFYGMVCGSLPFEEKTTKELYKKVIQGFYVLPSDISMDAIEVIQKMLNTDPQKRITIPELRKLKFFKEIKQIEPELIGLIVGFHAMPIDNEIVQKMKNYAVFQKKQVENSLKNNQHNSLTTLYYLIQKKTLRDGGKTIVDLQAYLETCEKYKQQYGKQTLKKYQKLLLQQHFSKKSDLKKSSDQKKQIREKSLKKDETKNKERHFFSNEKIKKKIYTASEDRKLNLSRKNRYNEGLKTERSLEKDESKLVNKSRSKTKQYTEVSPIKNSETKKMTLDLWQAYFKNPLDDVEKRKSKLTFRSNEKATLLSTNIKKLKEGFLKLPTMGMKRLRQKQLAQK